LAHKSSATVADLSGGQKRKLQLAISLMGNAQFVLLDEPTSGMDPTARRETWEVIKKAKKDRLIILTTHYMDEAEYLADRVAIMSGGQLKCCGSSLFLKNKYGTGFILQVEKRDNSQDLKDLSKLINELTIDNPEQIKVKTDEAGNTVFELPKALSPKFSELFSVLDADLASFNIK
jgi:ATP-binding cassette subfamily A (ABC1) protein 3